jgi:hypothetical protein
VQVNLKRARARILFSAVFFFLLATGCATTTNDSRSWVHPVYQEKIREWQTRIQREGWTEGQVHSLLLQFRQLATYRMEIDDHWDTPRDFMERGFSGDCKNIAVYEMGVLKQLGYPYGIRILIVHAMFEDHALLKVEMPGGGWKAYDVVPESVPVPKPALLKPVAEFDEKMVGWFAPQTPLSGDGRQSRSVAARERPQE